MENDIISEEIDGLIPKDEDLDFKEFNSYIEEMTGDEEATNELIAKHEEFSNTMDKATVEINTKGTISNETALLLVNQYNYLDNLLGNQDELSVESATLFKNEVYMLTRENSEKGWFQKLLDKFIAFCKKVYYKIVEYSTKLGTAITRQEVTASKLASYISDNLDNYKKDKWEFMIPYSDILGNFAILKDFNKSSIEKFIIFNNGGFRSKELIELYYKCLDKRDMTGFKKLTGIPVDYNINNYFKNYSEVKAVPIDVYGATGHCILSYKDGDNYKLERRKFSIVADNTFRSSLKTKGILSREDMVSILRQINISVRNNKDTINKVYNHIQDIQKTLNNLNDGVDSKFMSTAINCGSILINSLSISTRVGLFSNSFIIRVISKMAKVYKLQNKHRQ